MIGSRLCIQPITAVTSLTADHTNAATSRSVSHSISFDFSPIHLPLLRSRRFRFPKPKSFLISCNSSPIRSTSGDHHHNNNDTDFLEASLLLSGFSACTGGDNTLEDFLVKAGALPVSHLPQYSSSSEPSHSLDVAAVGKRKAVAEAVELDKAALQRQKRMIKNRESAARSRERKQAYINELERLVKNLETENKLLIEEEEERKKERLKQLKELVLPITEQRQNRRLRRSNSI